MAIACLVRRFDMELYETTIDSVSIGRDLGIGQPDKGEFAVRVKVTRVLE